MPPTKKTSFQPIGQIMTRIMTRTLKKSGFANAQQAQITARWQEIVGARLAEQSRPRTIKNGVLFIHAELGAALEIQHAQPDIITAANQICGHNLIQRIKIIQR